MTEEVKEQQPKEGQQEQNVIQTNGIPSARISVKLTNEANVTREVVCAVSTYDPIDLLPLIEELLIKSNGVVLNYHRVTTKQEGEERNPISG